MSDLFTRLATALRPGEGLLFSVNALPEDRIEVVLQPRMPEAADLPDDAAQIRAALALPLRLTGTAAEVDALFEARLAEYRETRREAADAFGDLMQTLKQATGKARKQAASAPAKAGKKQDDAGDTPPPSADTTPEPAPAPASDTNPDSLF